MTDHEMVTCSKASCVFRNSVASSVNRETLVDGVQCSATCVITAAEISRKVVCYFSWTLYVSTGERTYLEPTSAGQLCSFNHLIGNHLMIMRILHGSHSLNSQSQGACCRAYN